MPTTGDRRSKAKAEIPPPTARAPRADARRNRDRVITAALAVFAESGVDAQMADIAKAANVGVATLYRNFPTKEDLVHTLLIDFVDRARQVVEQATATPNAWEGLVRFLHWLTSVQLENRALPQFLDGSIPGTEDLEKHRAALVASLTELTDRAKAAGDLRTDVNSSDIRFLLFAIARLTSRAPSTPESTQTFARLAQRFVAIALAGLRPTDEFLSEGPPVQPEELDALQSKARRARPSSAAFKRGRRAWPVGS